jgi:hypothetical protein
MCDEPLFLDDETLVCNLDEAKAKRVKDWLITVHQKAPQDEEHALYLAREINNFYRDTSEDAKEDHLIKIETDCSDSFCLSEVHDSNIFDRIMSQLEEKYAEK